MTESTFLKHEACPECGSSDALARYSDGHAHCFSCSYYEKGEAQDTADRPERPRNLLPFGQAQALVKRKLTEETCRKWGYTVGDKDGKVCQIANYRDTEGNLVAQKVRFPNKDFTFLGDPKSAALYGQWLWRDGGKMVVVTEGEIDALTVSQLQNNKWPVVSVPNGAQGAEKSLRKHIDWLEKFDSIILMFDMDEPGRKASVECAQIFTPGKAKIATLPLKDPSDCLQAGRGAEVISAIWDAKVYRPDGIVSGQDLWHIVADETAAQSTPYPWKGLNLKTLGLRLGELVTITAGAGIGKSAIVREIAKNLHDRGETVGMLMLEENVRRTALGMMGLHLDKPLHICRDGVSPEELRAAFDATMGTGRFYLYDHFGSTAIDNLLSRVRYLAVSCGCRWIILDHLSIVVSGLGDGDERRLIDNAMTALRTLVQELGIGLLLVSHLKRPEGKGHEEGAQTSLAQLRGSAAIAQLSDIVLGAERDQQGERPNLTILRVLKNRFTGETGVAAFLVYDRATGRLSEVDGPEDAPFADETGSDADCPF